MLSMFLCFIKMVSVIWSSLAFWLTFECFILPVIASAMCIVHACILLPLIFLLFCLYLEVIQALHVLF